MPPGSPVLAVEAVDRPGNRIATTPRTAYGLWLERNIKHAELVWCTSADSAFEQFKRQLEQGWGMGPGGMAPSLGGPNMELSAPEGKPRLGVGLAAVSDDLCKRFNNDAKTGTFVMSVVPGTAAEKAGLNVGDAITSFDKKDIKTPEDLMEAVQTATAGNHELVVLRKNKELALTANLGSESENAPALGYGPRGPWLRRLPAPSTPAEKATSSARTEVKVSALEVSDDLAKSLKLSADQRKKMSAVLAKESKGLSEEVASNGQSSAGGGSFTFSFGGDVNKWVEKHIATAEKELSGILDADQMQTWKHYCQEHNSVSVSQSTVIQNGEPAEDTGDPGTGF